MGWRDFLPDMLRPNPQPLIPQAAWDGGDMVVSGARQVQHLLAELDQIEVRVHANDGAFFGLGRVRVTQDNRVALAMKPATPRPPRMATRLNVIGPSGTGTVLFTLIAPEPDEQGRLCANLPGEVIRMQSRDAYRVRGFHGKKPRASLRLSEHAAALPLHDLSERGLGLRLSTPTLEEGTCYTTSTLELDTLTLPLPRLRVVYCLPAGPQHWRAGARIENLAEPQARVLRRWIDQKETRAMA
ncbi:MAG: PilZ domain-containing protein [Rhodoferax sp.]|nr:PilZ domain-containing protein [Rhodoferax sp.]MCF8211511.1 PilZ domain-containing protein [Rhodoferax sp.]